ncbi:hypothetical protein [Hyphomonas chukchiensis]|uniref:Uncharacterized protein n=1 Tax=Hyphomonas chukchiensis TaxID=1280947 RepID=A0A062UT04_9PROT|nr:hypothetical protein [Hyphomonas chukchiensis]KCZ60932.1 hypothetical protein HY30_00940 [Hyphomonas chukchiensis]|tara:strand:+ start:157 stop:963 length:807 start_codon:yes stop_codon:yes gene_type:complete
MTEAVWNGSTKAATRPQFYVWMAGACLAIAVLGFAPTYALPLATGKFFGPPLIHVHAAILYTWMIYFFVQSSLVARGQVLAHRTWGMLGISIVTAMVFMTLTVSAIQIAQASLPGQPEGLAHNMRAFKWISVGGMLFIATVFTLAIVSLRKPEVHKRLIVLMTISMLGAPIARWFIFFLAPASDAAAHVNDPLPYMEVPPVFVALPPSLIGDLLLVVAMVYDWRTRGRPHQVYLIGGAALLLLQLTSVPVSQSAPWQAAAAWLGSIAG